LIGVLVIIAYSRLPAPHSATTHAPHPHTLQTSPTQHPTDTRITSLGVMSEDDTSHTHTHTHIHTHTYTHTYLS